ncbi:preprotein translocase subunit SecY [Pseudonocardia sp. GCM10023141]|uniref:preprotein translocase subunit SecY n=1 Tax=Pseudonocardia sp. GCM10023141 TaxID=3252653 RepID=UPI003610CCB1
MLRTVRSLLAAPDLRRRILITLAVVVVARFGSAIPAPGVSFPNVQQCAADIERTSGGTANISDLFNLLSGGALLQLSIFAIGILPFISASIMIQLLTVVIPRFTQLRSEGQSGQVKLNQYTRYLTMALATLQAASVVTLAVRGTLLQGCALPVIPNADPGTLAVLVVVMVAGAAVLMRLGEQVTEKGIGNGISILMFTSIAHRIPADLKRVYESTGLFGFIGICVFGVAIIASVVLVEQAQRRIPVQYAKRMVGRRMYGGTSTYLPIKVNQAGVIPVIFASSLLSLPTLVAPLLGGSGPVAKAIQVYLLDQSSWVHNVLSSLMIVGFAYFYIGITFDPAERASELKKFGGFIPGLRPGRVTLEYLRFVVNRITLPGAAYLAIIAVLPNLLLGSSGGQGQFLPFGGTTVLIMVGVGLETLKQLEAQLIQHHYQGFLR